MWGKEDFELLGLNFNINLEKSTTKNDQKAILKITDCIKSWNKHHSVK